LLDLPGFARGRTLRAAPQLSTQRGGGTSRSLWSALTARQLGVSFRRQVPVVGFSADFCAPALKLIIEVDGPIHTRKRSSDARRDLKLHRTAFRIVRISAALVLSNLPAAIALVRAAL
jgi:very-short-patch-repair endonuclease